MSTNLATIGTITEVLPIVPPLNVSIVAAELSRYTDSAAKATDIAGRAIIEDQDSYDRGADVVKGISSVLKELDANRKAKTDPAANANKVLMTLYGSPKTLLEQAKEKLSGKMLVWERGERARRAEEAAAKEAAQKAHAEALARATASMGDAEGAAQIIAEAQELAVVPEKVVAQGLYGATGGVRKLPVGEITDMRAFLSWALREAPSIIGAVEIGKSVLNRLASSALENSPDSTIPGFKFGYNDSLTIR